MREQKLSPPEDKTPRRIALRSSGVAFTLGAATFLLVLASTALFYLHHIKGIKSYGWLYRFFSVGREWKFAASFNAALLFFAFLLLTFITVSAHKRKTTSFRYWAILAFGFLFMTIDELCSLHERLGPPMRTLLGSGPYGFFFFSWVIVAIPVVFILILAFIKFWWQLPVKTRLNFLLAAVVYLGGCLGFELIGGYYAEKHGFVNMTVCLLEAAEESLEMGGVIIFIWGLLNYMEDSFQEEIRTFAGFVKRQTQNLPFSKR